MRASALAEPGPDPAILLARRPSLASGFEAPHNASKLAVASPIMQGVPSSTRSIALRESSERRIESPVQQRVRPRVRRSCASSSARFLAQRIIVLRRLTAGGAQRLRNKIERIGGRDLSKYDPHFDRKRLKTAEIHRQGLSRRRRRRACNQRDRAALQIGMLFEAETVNIEKGIETARGLKRRNRGERPSKSEVKLISLIQASGKIRQRVAFAFFGKPPRLNII